jgi:hypothetical protein
MISIFARPSYLGNVYPKHTKELNTHRLSSRIRGEEICAYGNFKLNPRRGYKNDIKIWVKPTGITHIGDGEYVDVLDGLYKDRTILLAERPKINVIAASYHSYRTLRSTLPNKVVLIPHQHLNWEDFRRTKRAVNTCGYIGSPSPWAFEHYEKIGKEIRKMGMKWVTCFDYKTREDPIKLFKKIDILVVGGWHWGDSNPHKMPTKLINAASFGIPSVAYPLNAYRELKGHYIGADNMEQIIKGVRRLKDDARYYQRLSEKVLFMSKKYHISEIVKLYEKLE